MAGQELAVFVSIRRERVKSISSVAALVSSQVLRHVIAHEPFQQVQLEIVVLIELLALHCLSVCVVIVGVAAVGKDLKELLLPLESQFGENALLHVHGEALDRISHLHEGLGLDAPGIRVALEGVQRLGLLLGEEL